MSHATPTIAHRLLLSSDQAAALTGLLAQHDAGGSGHDYRHEPVWRTDGDAAERASRNAILAERAVALADACLERLAVTQP